MRNKHLLSLKDLNLTQKIAELIDSGVTSLKVEGRLKDIGYVKNITAHYQQIIDDIIEKKPLYKKASSGLCIYTFSSDPERTFNRGYTSYFSTGREIQMTSFNTQKSIGKEIGRALEITKKFITVEASQIINNNDGLCFIGHDGRLNGFKVNKVEGDKLFPGQNIEIPKGAILYRNYDHCFNQMLNQTNSSTRQIECTLSLIFDDDIISIQLTDENAITTEVQYSSNFELALKPEEMINTINGQLKKTGSTPFVINKIEIINKANGIPFVPIRQINFWRRELLEKHSETRISRHCKDNKYLIPNSVSFPEIELKYNGNVINKLAEKFYQRHGVKIISEGFEIKEHFANTEVMRSKFCLLFEMGLCGEDRKATLSSKVFFLKDNNSSYRLLFNCNTCEMSLLYPVK